MYDLIVVGAGVAGLSAARQLRAAGWRLVVLEKSRGLGGRAATRRVEGNRVDHGAQYFTVRDARFQRQVDDWLAAGAVRVWQRGFHRLDEDGLHAPEEGHPRYIFPQGMNEIGKRLAEGVDVWRKTKVASLKPLGDFWQVETEAGETFEGRHVLVNTPAEQALALCSFDLEPEIEAALKGVEMAPCFALMLGFKELAPAWAGITVNLPNSPLGWVAHDSSKRDVPGDTVIVLHSTHAFARAHYDTDPGTVEHALLEALGAIDERFRAPLWTNLQRWRYAQATHPLDASLLAQEGLVFCGDWCGGKRLEAAYLSGLAAAQTLAPEGKMSTK